MYVAAAPADVRAVTGTKIVQYPSVSLERAGTMPFAKVNDRPSGPTVNVPTPADVDDVAGL